MPFHLLFPLFSSLTFVLGMMFVKQAIERGVSPWTGALAGNLWLALIWGSIAAVRGRLVPWEAWPDAGIIGLLFVLGQVFTYLAYQIGDVSVATPVFGVKVLMVAVLTALLAGQPVERTVWIAGAMASLGIILIQWTGRTSGQNSWRRQALTIGVAMLAAFSLSLFDVCLQKWTSHKWHSLEFLPVMFGSAACLSVVFLPQVDFPQQVRRLGATRWLLGGTLLMALQAMSMCFALAQFGDAPRMNIVYALRGLWGVVLVWLLARRLRSSEAGLPRQVMLQRLFGAALLTIAVLLAIQV